MTFILIDYDTGKILQYDVLHGKGSTVNIPEGYEIIDRLLRPLLDIVVISNRMEKQS